MTRVLAVVAVGLMLGGVMAADLNLWSLSPGWWGLAAMTVIATAARQRWFGLALAAPGSPERGLWIGLGSGAVLAGHMGLSLYRIGADMAMHSPQVHAFAIDSWVLVLGGVLAWAIARDPRPRRDERDAQIATLGLRWSHYTLVGLIAAGLVPLGYGWTASVAAMSHAMIAQLLIVALMVSWVVDSAVRLREYRRDAIEASE